MDFLVPFFGVKKKTSEKKRLDLVGFALRWRLQCTLASNYVDGGAKFGEPGIFHVFSVPKWGAKDPNPRILKIWGVVDGKLIDGFWDDFDDNFFPGKRFWTKDIDGFYTIGLGLLIWKCPLNSLGIWDPKFPHFGPPKIPLSPSSQGYPWHQGEYPTASWQYCCRILSSQKAVSWNLKMAPRPLEKGKWPSEPNTNLHDLGGLKAVNFPGCKMK